MRQITDGIGEHFPNITSDGKWLIHVSPSVAPNSIWKKSLTSDEKPIKFFDSAAGDNSISPDNKQLVVSYFGKGISDQAKFRYGLISFEPAAQIQDLGFNPGGMHSNNWKADGSGFYYIDREIETNNIWFYSIADKSKQQITDLKEMKVSQFSLSPAGNTAAVSRGAVFSNIFKINGF